MSIIYNKKLNNHDVKLLKIPFLIKMLVANEILNIWSGFFQVFCQSFVCYKINMIARLLLKINHNSIIELLDIGHYVNVNIRV